MMVRAKAAFHVPPTCATSLFWDPPALCARNITICGELLIVTAAQWTLTEIQDHQQLRGSSREPDCAQCQWDL